MSDKIKKSDLFEEGLFDEANAGAEKMLTNVKNLTASLAKFIELTRNELNVVNPKSYEDIQKINKGVETLNVASKTYSEALEKQAKAEQQLEKVKQQKIKTEKEQLSLSEKQAKAVAKQTKEQEKLNSEYQQTNERLKQVKKELKDLIVAEKQATPEFAKLSKEFETLDKKVRAAEEAVGEFQRNVGNYPKQLKEVQKALQGLEPGSEEFNKLAKRAGELKDKINDAKDATKAFATESKTTTAKTLFGQVFNDLKDLDFKGAAEKAKTLASVVSSISFKEVADGAKNFGSSIASLGSAIFLNPFVLIAGAITGVVLALKQQYDAYQEVYVVAQKYNAIIEEQRQKLSDLQKENRNTTLEILNLQGKITDVQLKRSQRENEYKDQFVKNRQAEAEAIKNARKDFESLATPTALEMGLFNNLGGKELYFKRLASLTKQQKSTEEGIRKSFRETEKQLQENFGNDILKIILEAAKNQGEAEKSVRIKNTKEIIKQQLFDWEAYYDELDTLSAENNQDELQRALELENIRFEQAKRSAQERIKTKKELDAIIEQLEIQHQNNINKILADSQKDAKKIKGVLDDEDFKIRQKQLADEKALRDKRQKELFEYGNKILDLVEQELEREAELRRQALDNDIKNRERQVSTQQRLAEKGLQNTLTAENKFLAEAELRREQEKRDEISRQQAVAFFRLVAGYAEKDPATAIPKALLDIALAKVVAGAFYEGTENVADSLGKPVISGRDGYVVRVDGSERVMTGEQNKMIGDLSNWELAKLAYLHNNDMLLNPSMVNDSSLINSSTASNISTSAVLNQLVGVNKRLESLEQSIVNKREQHVNWDNHGNMVIGEVEKGVKRSITYVKRKPKI